MPLPNRHTFLFCLLSAAAAPACAPDVTGVFETTTSGTGGGGDGGSGTTSSAGATGGTGGTTSTPSTTGTTSTGSGGCDQGAVNADDDGDGFTEATGDCNDCEPAVNPGAVEVADNEFDDDCNGTTNDVPEPCDEGLALDTMSGDDVARAIELCKKSTGEGDWGVYATEWSLPDGAPIPGANVQNFHLGHGVLSDFGPQVPPRAGTRLAAFSSGTARRPSDPGFQAPQGFSKGYSCNHAPGFPKETPTCPGAAAGGAQDATALTIGIRVPSNAKGIAYDFTFYAHDFPGYVCSAFDDTFFALLQPQIPGTPDTNIAFDDMGNPVTLNSANFRVCSCQNGPPCMAGGKAYTCELGDLELVGTGFDGMGGQPHGATGWLTTLAPVEPGSTIEIRFGIYDAADAIADSTVLIDDWRWITGDPVSIDTIPGD